MTMADVGIMGMKQPTQAGFEDFPLPLKRLTQGLEQALLYTTLILHINNNIYISYVALDDHDRVISA